MAHKILQSLAGTSMQYFVVQGNEGFRIRKLGDDMVRIHIEKDAPNIDSRNRPKSMRKVPYWACDLSLEGLLRALGLVVGAGEGAFLSSPVESSEEASTATEGEAPEGIEQVMAALVVRLDDLNAKKEALASEVKAKEKERQGIIDERKALNALKGKLANGMQAYVEAKEALS